MSQCQVDFPPIRRSTYLLCFGYHFFLCLHLSFILRFARESFKFGGIVERIFIASRAPGKFRPEGGKEIIPKALPRAAAFLGILVSMLHEEGEGGFHIRDAIW